jgi:hypothetical protein
MGQLSGTGSSVLKLLNLKEETPAKGGYKPSSSSSRPFNGITSALSPASILASQKAQRYQRLSPLIHKLRVGFGDLCAARMSAWTMPHVEGA